MRSMLRLVVAVLLVPIAAAAVFAWVLSPLARTKCPGPNCGCAECVVEWGLS